LDLSAAERQQALCRIASALETAEEEILRANQQDLEHAQALLKSGELSESAFARLKLDHGKIQTMAAGVRSVASLPELVGTFAWRRELDQGLVLERVTCPLGVIAVIFESRPDAVAQITSLAIKTANSVLLKGGSEALHSCRAITQVIHSALGPISNFPQMAVQLLTERQETHALLGMAKDIDLIIPRGSQQFVRFIQTHTQIPVLGHADGICHLYVDAAADLDMAVALAVDAKVQYPAACNAIETLLVHEAIAPSYLPAVAIALRNQGVELRGCDLTRQWVAMTAATAADWGLEYGDLILSIRVVKSLEEALEHIHTYGSRHTEAIVTQEQQSAERFLQQVDAAGVFHNASTRFADGFRYGFGAEVGISTQKLPPRGPVGMEGLVTYTYHLRGQGQVVADYTGAEARAFSHRDLS
jgi:glutamate-5-semialdehyde dehydrogenase